MFRRINKAAAEFSNRVSRRGFLDRLGRTALTAATALGGLLALQAQARAATREVGRCCLNAYGKRCRLRKWQSCPEGWIETYCYIPLRGNLRFCDEL